MSAHKQARSEAVSAPNCWYIEDACYTLACASNQVGFWESAVCGLFACHVLSVWLAFSLSAILPCICIVSVLLCSSSGLDACVSGDVPSNQQGMIATGEQCHQTVFGFLRGCCFTYSTSTSNKTVGLDGRVNDFHQVTGSMIAHIRAVIRSMLPRNKATTNASPEPPRFAGSWPLWQDLQVGDSKS